jgi:hypothetical protein
VDVLPKLCLVPVRSYALPLIVADGTSDTAREGSKLHFIHSAVEGYIDRRICCEHDDWLQASSGAKM